MVLLERIEKNDSHSPTVKELEIVSMGLRSLLTVERTFCLWVTVARLSNGGVVRDGYSIEGVFVLLLVVFVGIFVDAKQLRFAPAEDNLLLLLFFVCCSHSLITPSPYLCFISVDADEIKRLGKRFKKLDLDNSGSLSVEEFMSLPELQQNPLVQRVIDIFDTDGNGEVDFKEFIEGVSQFSVKGDKEQKLRFAFRIYDMDKDGYISNGELFQVLKMMVGNNLKDTQLQQIVDKTIINADKDGDGRISFEEFCAVSTNDSASASTSS
ncbi:hypothetical protein L3Q82_020113 [Scortum barcoo]|uniref:Uncharacterized protein n=1 Tax=Scortum barcoo TaxID=214431 RepID=A0ACB8VDD9_9TELE|nr:hypothetical protein L3Q82_020113 [Scortum barcoo]